MKKLGALLVLVLAALTIVACGSSSSDTTASETTSGGEATSEAAGGSSEGQKTAGGSTVQIEAVEGSGLEYKQKSVTTKAGQVAIEFTNPQSLDHDVAVENSKGEMVGSTELVASGKTVGTIGKLEPGEYTYYCTVPGHREAGMEGTLIVK